MPVYFIGRGRKGPIKIGFSKDPHKRMKSLQTANAEPLHLMAVVEGGRRLEKLIQRELSSYLISGEWFQRAPRVEDFIQRVDEEAKRVLREDDSRTEAARAKCATKDHPLITSPSSPVTYGSMTRFLFSFFGKTQIEQAKALGITQSAVSRKVSDKNRPAIMERHAVSIAAAAMEIFSPQLRNEVLKLAAEMRADIKREMEAWE